MIEANLTATHMQNAQESVIWQRLENLPKLPGLFTHSFFKQGHTSDLLVERLKRESSVIPRLGFTLNGIRVDLKQVESYAKLCSYYYDHQHLPICYPHLLAFRLQLKLMNAKAFPLPVMGLVHTKNTIEQHQPIPCNSQLNLEVYIADEQLTEKGLSFDIVSKISVNNQLHWQGTSQYLYRKPEWGKLLSGELTQKTDQTSATKNPSLPCFRYEQPWVLKNQMGRQYARVSGDANPIHLHPLSAKLFGFNNAIAHGMFLKAKATASLQPLFNEHPIKVTTEFKQPTPLPSCPQLNYQWQHGSHIDQYHSNAALEFALINKPASKLHMTGRIQCLGL